MFKVIAFDLFGTVFSLASAEKQEIRDYIAHVRKEKWEPLSLPSSWEYLELFEDSYFGLKLLSEQYQVVSCSNAPLDFTQRLFYNNGLDFMGITDISVERVYKPHPASYLSICKQFYCEPEDVLMVTGNYNSPDIQGALDVDIASIMIRQEGCLKDIIELSNYLIK